MKISYQFYKLTNFFKGKIGYRTLKTAIATPLSMAIAQFLGVNNVATAGILAILCIQPSRKESFRTASDRFLSCLLAIAFSAFFFELFGYSALILSLLLMVFIPTTIFFKIENGILTSTVITLNIYLFKNLNLDFISNQLYLIIIGIGTGFLVNLYMPSLDKKLESLKKSVEVRFQIILYQIAEIIQLEKNVEWEKKEILELKDLLKKATELVNRDKENQMHENQHTYYDYFEMRKNQFSVLEEIIDLVERLPKNEEIGTSISSFIEKIGKSVSKEDSALFHLEELQFLKENFKQAPLPNTYEGFEARSILFQILYEIERYLDVKRRLMQPEK